MTKKSNFQIESENRFYNLRKVADAAKKAFPEIAETSVNRAIMTYNGFNPDNCRTYRKALQEGITREQLDQCPRCDIFGFNSDEYRRENPTAPRLYALSTFDLSAFLEPAKPAKARKAPKKAAKPAASETASVDDLPF